MQEKEIFEELSTYVKQQYPNQEGIYYQSIIPYFLGGDSPLEGIEIWKNNHQMPHWHYITYGYSMPIESEELQEQNCGFGFEMTFRLKKGQETQPPDWPMNLLKNLANYVFSSGNSFDVGHHINCNGAIALEEETQLTALAFVQDPEMKSRKTQNGTIRFLQAVALTNCEMEALMCWNGEKFVELMQKENPLLITDLSRSCCMEKEEFSQAWKTGVEQDGSSTGVLYTDGVKIEQEKNGLCVSIGAGHITTLCAMLKARVGKGKQLLIESEEVVFCFQSAEKSTIEKEEGMFILNLSQDSLCEILKVLKPEKGTYALKSVAVRFEVSTTEIKDSEGKIIQVIE